MKRLRALRHEFVEFIPERLQHGVLYISIEYATTAHLCACGCGNEVTNPLAPHAWRMTFDGRAVSLSPSVGNWSFDCESHYWIRSDEIDWVGGFNRTQIDAGRARRRRDIDAAISGRSKRRRVPESGTWLERMKGHLRRHR